ncbi:MAG: sensor domain-containing diguanylate cyclase [Denitromonas halophila]|nr:MAG: sensor domain-containing diguanylate cyclase [Denitromonas halophila]TVT67621.1 MAG: sensor domain-containing diguanylate cyclase [Denitromonas halophila]
MDSLSFTDFASASRAVLSYLHRKLGFKLWMVTRTEGEDWIVLDAEDHGYGVEAGTVFRWADSFCSEMVKGNGPRIAPQSDTIPAYTTAPIGQQVEIKAYIGLPLTRADGSLFGTLCAIDPAYQPESITEELPQIELLGALLSTILHSELNATDEKRRAERLAAEAMTDAQTGLYNRRGWDVLVRQEEARCRRYGHKAAILVADLDGLKTINDTRGHAAGDALIAQTADVLRRCIRSNDIVARLGGDEFGILSVECDRAGADGLFERVRAAAQDAGIELSLGLAMRGHVTGLEATCEAADQAMFEDKRARKAARD